MAKTAAAAVRALGGALTAAQVACLDAIIEGLEASSGDGDRLRREDALSILKGT
jgi:hypothetical protein